MIPVTSRPLDTQASIDKADSPCMSKNRLIGAATALLVFAPMTAFADVWKWVDVHGNTHFVETQTPIYWWMDEIGKVHYSDSPDHEDAVAVELVWHSSGRLDAAVKTHEERMAAGEGAETDAERAAREAQEAHYCKRVQEIYESYKSAPKIYRTDANGEKEYLRKSEARALIRDVKGKRDTLCK